MDVTGFRASVSLVRNLPPEVLFWKYGKGECLVFFLLKSSVN